MPKTGTDSTARKTIVVVLSTLVSVALILGVILLLNSRDDGPSGASESIQGELLVTVMDVGQGQAVVVIAPDGHSMLIDSSRSQARVRNLIVPYLQTHGVEKLDYLVLSHPDQDHIGGMPEVLDLMQVGRFVDPAISTTNQTYAEILEKVLDLGLNPILARRGTELDMGEGMAVRLLWPVDPLLESGGEPETNNNSAVVQVRFGETEVLVTGDAEKEAELAMVDLDRNGDLQSDVLVVGHHGSKTSSSARFLDAVSPETALISVGLNNQYGHPHDEVIQRLRMRGIDIYRTDLDGSIEVRSDGSTYEVSPLGTEATP